MNNPLVTIVVCVFNAVEFIAESLASTLDQTYSNLEIIVIDDGSTDGSAEVVARMKDSRVRLLQQANAGKPTAMNRALAEASGEFYALQDADDVSRPARIERQVDRMLREPSLAAVFCGHELILDGRTVAPRFRNKEPAECRREIDGFRMPAHDPTAMYRMSAVADLRYAEDLPIVEGFDYVLRVGERASMCVLGECLYAYRVHSNSVTRRDVEKRERLREEVIRRAFVRRGMSYDNAGNGRVHRRDNSLLDNNLHAHFVESAVELRDVGRWADAWRAGITCARLHPLDVQYWKPLAYVVMPRALRGRVRRSNEERGK